MVGVHRWALPAVFLALAACSGAGPFESRESYAERLAAERGWERLRVPAGRFVLTGFAKGLASQGADLAVYIEGDGLAWRSRHVLSRDPTPRNPTGLKLALHDPAPKVLYLARPCQYAAGYQAGCDPIYWDSHRYAAEVVESLGQAIDEVKARTGARSLSLVGYSGGGVAAALVAATRDDVRRLATVAANLDHAYWTRLHDVSPLDGSLNPPDFAGRLRRVPQTHYVGADDDIVPADVVRSYLRALGDPPSARLDVVAGFDHDCCWVEAWPLAAGE